MRISTDRHHHDRLLLGLMGTMLVVLVAETCLRLAGIISQATGELLFGGGLSLGIGGTVLLALTAPPHGARAEEPVADGDADAARPPTAAGDRRTPPLAAPALPVRRTAVVTATSGGARDVPSRRVAATGAAALLLVASAVPASGIGTAEPDDRPDGAPAAPVDVRTSP